MNLMTKFLKINSNKVSLLIYGSIVLAACAPTTSQLKESIDRDPSIIFSAIEKHPDQFMDAVMKAQQGAQKVAAEKAEAEEKKQHDSEFTNPLKPELQAGRPIFGSKTAPITIFEYSDFQCPYCSRGYQTIKQVRTEYGDKVRVVFKHLPLDFHPLAMPAAIYFEAIAQQSAEKAEKFHDLVFENQGQMKDKGEKLLAEMAKKTGADMKKVNAALKDPKIKDKIEADMAEAKSFGMNGTPGFIINGVSLRGAYPFPAFKEIIDRHLASAKK